MKIQQLAVSLAFTLAAAAAGAAELGEMRLYECVKTSAPPKIDGRLDDACWQTAATSSGFTRTLRDADKPPSVQTHIQLTYDDANLYVGIKCDEPHPELIKAAIFDDDTAAVCGDDCVEMFFHPNPQSKDYYQLAANSRGVRYDGCRLDGSWNGQWQAAATVGKDAWYLECAIAFDSFPDRAGVWRFNVCRELRSTNPIEFHCWSNTFGGFHTPSRFGHLIFAGPLANLRRGFLIQAAHYAKTTLEKQQQLETQDREIGQMRAIVPAKRLEGFAKPLGAMAKDEAALIAKFANKRQLSLDEWRALDDGLGELIQRREGIYWDLKFYVLLND